jgi:hypothetical protein
VADGLALEFVGQSQQVARALDVESPHVGRDHPRARAHEQAAAEASFEVLDAAGQGRLADVHRRGSADEAAVLGQRDDLTQLL